MTIHKIGDDVWYASLDSEEEWILCPDCGGTKTFKVTLWNDVEHIIDCAGCSIGYGPPCGLISTYKRKPKIQPGTITGIEIMVDKDEEYRIQCGQYAYFATCEKIGNTTEEAHEKSKLLVLKLEKEDQQRINKKEKDTRTWAWNVHYHRKRIREAKRNIEYHTAKLAAARPEAAIERKKKKTPQ